MDIKNLPTIISSIVKNIPTIITSIVKAFLNGVSSMAKAGGNLLAGLQNRSLLGHTHTLSEISDISIKNELLKKYEAARSKREEYREEILEKKVRRERIEQFLDTLRRSGNLVTEFDDGMWNALIERLTVYSYARVVFTFKDGTKVE